jgi:hypothetical protein
MITGPFAFFAQLFSTMPPWLILTLKIAGPIILVLVLFFLAVQTYRQFIQERFISNIEWTLFEIKIPKDVPRTPAAMELVIQAMHQHGGVGTWIKRWIDGAVLMWFSLEMVSQGGRIRFFIRTPSKFRDYVESQIYAQYPQAEITEVEDYTRDFPPYDPKGSWKMIGADFKLAKPDPYPLRTYVDYGLHESNSLDEEQKIDPLNQVIEFLGSMKPQEHFWIQINIRFHPKRFPIRGSWFKKQTWVEEAENLRDDLVKKFGTVDDPASGKTKIDFNQITAVRKFVIESIERSVTKYGFDAGLRTMYIAENEQSFDGRRIPAMLTVLKPFGSQHLNGFKLNADTFPDFDYPWQDFKGWRAERRKKKMYRAYVDRGIFYTPHHRRRKPFILNTEELATIFHFPGKVAVTPGIERVGVRTAEAPTNLPT